MAQPETNQTKFLYNRTRPFTCSNRNKPIKVVTVGFVRANSGENLLWFQNWSIKQRHTSWQNLRWFWSPKATKLKERIRINYLLQKNLIFEVKSSKERQRVQRKFIWLQEEIVRNSSLRWRMFAIKQTWTSWIDSNFKDWRLNYVESGGLLWSESSMAWSCSCWSRRKNIPQRPCSAKIVPQIKYASTKIQLISILFDLIFIHPMPTIKLISSSIFVRL